MNLQKEITRLVEEKIAGSELFLVEVKAGPGKITVILDHPRGVKIEDCVEVNRMLRAHYEETPVFETHELEVGSPGMEEPLKVIKQYQKRIGSSVGVVTFDGLKHLGILKSVNDEGIELEETVTVKTGSKKEKQIQTHTLPFTQIKETRVNFQFDKIISSK